MFRLQFLTQFSHTTCGTRARILYYTNPSCCTIRSMLDYMIHITDYTDILYLLSYYVLSLFGQIPDFYTSEADQEEGKIRASSCKTANVILSHTWLLARQIKANKQATSNTSRGVTIGDLWIDNELGEWECPRANN